MAIMGSTRGVSLPFGAATVNDEGLWCVQNREHDVLWVPDQALNVKERLRVCPCIKRSSLQGAATTLDRLR